MYELLIIHQDETKEVYFEPLIEDKVTWKLNRQGSAGELTFKYQQDEALTKSTVKIEEGNAVRLKKDGKNVFFGFLFEKKQNKDGVISCKAYDQLRYFKNKDRYVYENKTYSEFLNMLMADFNLQAGEIADTNYKIPSRVENNTTLFDMCQNAYNLTLQNTKKMYVLFDDFGKLTLKNIADMQVPLLIDEDTAQNYDMTTSIDKETYNMVKLSYDDKESGTRKFYVAKDTSNINRWGMLQYYEKLQKEENGKEKAKALLSLYNEKTKSLSIKGVLGDIRVRAGSLVLVNLKISDMIVQHWMLVEKCTHTFHSSSHFMDLELRGGEFNA